MIDATPLLRAYAARRWRTLAAQDAVAAQRRQLRHLLAQGRVTRFGRAHDFAAIRSVANYQARVPLRRYEDFWREYWQPVFPVLQGATWPDRVPFLALSSGTTSAASKYIPVTAAMVRSNRRAALDMLVHHLRNHADSHVLAGQSFMLGGTTMLRDEGYGIRSGDLSGIATITVPQYARARTFPPADLALIPGWDEKIARIAAPSLDADIRAISGTPSWLLLFFEQLAALHPERPRRLASFYPHLELLVHGGVPYAAYAARMAEWLEGSRVMLREAYAASEGFVAMADRGPGDGLRLELDNGLFHEFVPLAELDAPNPTRHWIGNAETGVDYALVLTSNAGLWSYVIGDTVRLLDRDPPRLLITGRTGYFLSAFGEHVSAEEIERAVLGAGGRVAEFSAGAIHADAGEGDRHVLVVEFTDPPGSLNDFARRVDAALIAGNDDYRAHREGRQMQPPVVEVMRAGGFADWMKSRGKLGGQHKVPRIVTDPGLLASLRSFARD
jgi:hypothetical protein